MADIKLQMWASILKRQEETWDPWALFDAFCNTDGSLR